MSKLSVKELQIGLSSDASKNITLSQPEVEDGSLIFSRGEETPTELFTISNTGTLSFNDSLLTLDNIDSTGASSNQVVVYDDVNGVSWADFPVAEFLSTNNSDVGFVLQSNGDGSVSFVDPDSLSIDAATLDGNSASAFALAEDNVTIPDDGTVGSVSTPSSFSIDASGNVSFNQGVDISGSLTGVDASDVSALSLSGGTVTGNLVVDGTLRSGGVVVNSQTGTSYTFVLSDAGKFVTFDNSGAITVTVPPDSSVSFEVGATIGVAQLGTGTVSVVGGSGVTVSSLDGKVDLAGQYATASLVKTDTDSWLLVGALA